MKIWKFPRLLIIFILVILPVILAAETIYEIQYTEDPSGDSPLYGQVVTVSGIVTATGYYSSGSDARFFISDPEGGAWRGVFCFNYDYEVELGDEVEFSAEVDEYYGFTELKNIQDLVILSEGNPIPEPADISTFDAATQEAYEGCLVRINGVTVISSPNQYGEWYVDDGTGACQIDDNIYQYSGVSQGDEFYSIIGVIDYSYDNFGLNPRSSEDFIEMGLPQIEEIYIEPEQATVNQAVTVYTRIIDTEGFIFDVEIRYQEVTESAGSWVTEQMQPLPNDMYKKELPGLSDNDYYYFYQVIAEDSDGNTIQSEIMTIDFMAEGEPVIEEIVTDPYFPFFEEEVTVRATITDSSRSIELVNIIYRKLEWEINRDWTTEEMVVDPGNPDVYTAVLDTLHHGDNYEEYYEFKIYVMDDDGIDVESDIRIINGYDKTISLETIAMLNSPEAGENLELEAVVIDPFLANLRVWILYTKDYESEEYQKEMIQDTLDISLWRGTIGGQSAGTEIHIGLYAANDSLEVYFDDLLDYIYPVKSHKAILKVKPEPFDPYQRDGNPDNDEIKIEYLAQRGDRAIMRIYNSEGKLMLTPRNDVITSIAGINSYIWDGRDKNGELLPWGLYICHLEVLEDETGDLKTAQVPIVIGGPLK